MNQEYISILKRLQDPNCSIKPQLRSQAIVFERAFTAEQIIAHTREAFRK